MYYIVKFRLQDTSSDNKESPIFNLVTSIEEVSFQLQF